MENRLESLRNEIDKMIISCEPRMNCVLSSHLYGVSKFCTMLAIKRGLDTGIAAACGMLHDIYNITDSAAADHAAKGAVQARTILEATGAYSVDEIEIITSAIAKHSNKLAVDGCYDELLKDADVMDHCFYNSDYPVHDWETGRYNGLLREFGIIPTTTDNV